MNLSYIEASYQCYDVALRLTELLRLLSGVNP